MRTCAEIRDILLEEASVLKQMVDLEEQTQVVLIQGDAKALDELNEHKEQLMEKMSLLESQRRAAIPGDLTLNEYMSREAQAGAGMDELESLRQRLQQLHGSLQRLQDINKHLLQHNLKFIQHAMKVLFPQQQEEHLYAPSGEIKNKNVFPSKLLDSNA